MTRSNIVVQSGDLFCIRASQWAGDGDGNFTYLYIDGDWFGTSTKVNIISGEPLIIKYQFSFLKCNGSGVINFGDTVNLKSQSTNKYINCGAGTCSGNHANSCKTGDWEVFTIESMEGYTGQIMLGDVITIKQVVSGCKITPAGENKVWCQNQNGNDNFNLRLTKINGYITDDITTEIKELEIERKNVISSNDSFRATTDKIGDIFSGNIIISIVICLLCITSVMSGSFLLILSKAR